MEHNENKHVTAMSAKMLAVIALDDTGGIHGELDCAYFEEPFVFTSIVRMIEMMEATFDTKGFPEKHLLPRTYSKAKMRFRKHELDLQAYIREFSAAQKEPKPGGKTCAFEIMVRFRHNAEWQGQVHWIEKNVTKKFSSIVDLMKLIDNALKSE